MRKKFKVIFIIIALLIILFTVFYFSIKSNLEDLKNIQISDFDLNNARDGTYMGSFKSTPIEAEVKVIIKNHRIESIEIVKHITGKGNGAEVIPAKVVELQSLQVDTVSGATYSSKVILKAIENALRESIK